MFISKRLFILSILSILLFTSLCLSDTVVEGIVESAVWTPEGNPYYIIDEAEVPEGNTLVIKPGVVVYTYPGHPFNIYGELYCDGTENMPILFSSFDQNNRWDGLRILDGGTAHLLYTIVEYAGTVRPDEMHGGGISVVNSSITMSNCTVRYNHSDYDGGGIYIIHSAYTITHCIFHNNVCNRIGSAVDFAGGNGGVFSYNQLFENYSTASAAIYVFSGTHSIDHCTFYNNTAGQLAGDIRIYSGTQAFITNSIFWRDEAHSDNSIDLAGGILTASYCCSDDPIMGDDNIINQDPLFVDPTNYDLHLSADSPCINAGNPDFPYDEDGTITDLGALPATSSNPPPPPPGDEDTVTIPEIAVLRGGTYTIPVLCGPLSEDNIISFQGRILFPGDIIESINDVYFVEGGFFDDNWLLEYSVTNDTLSFSMAGSNIFGGSQPLFQIDFTVFEDILSGTYPITILELLTNENIVLGIDSGSITVSDFELGDVSLNGEVQAYDAGLLLTHLDNSTPLEEIQLQLGEVSGDDNISAYDASLILQKVSGLIDLFPIESAIEINEDGNVQVPYDVNNTGAGFSVPFSIDFIENVSSIVVDIEYDTEVIALPELIDSSEELYYAVEPRSYGARVHIVFDAPMTISEQEIFQLHFQSSSNHDQTLQINYIKFNDYTYDESINDVNIHWTSSVIDETIPSEFGLVGTYPNPFNSTTTIKFNLVSSGRVNMRVMNILGQTVDMIVGNQFMDAGLHVISWHADHLPAGNYFISFESKDISQVSKITLLK